MKWHELVGMKDERGNELNYIDLLNFWIPGRWFKLSKENGSRIQGRLRREAGTDGTCCFRFDASEHAPLVSRVTADTNHRVNEMSRISGNVNLWRYRHTQSNTRNVKETKDVSIKLKHQRLANVE